MKTKQYGHNIRIKYFKGSVHLIISLL